MLLSKQNQQRQEDLDVARGVAAAEAMQAEKQPKAEPEKDWRGPRIRCSKLQFIQNVSLPWNHFGTSLEEHRDPRQRQIHIDYLPRLQMYEINFLPAPGQLDKPICELLPREWASFRPA